MGTLPHVKTFLVYVNQDGAQRHDESQEYVLTHWISAESRLTIPTAPVAAKPVKNEDDGSQGDMFEDLMEMGSPGVTEDVTIGTLGVKKAGSWDAEGMHYTARIPGASSMLTLQQQPNSRRYLYERLPP